MLNEKKAGRFSPSAKIRYVWIPKQYLNYKNDFVAKGRVHVAIKWKKNGRYPYHSFEDSKQEAKNKKFSKENNVSSKERHVFPNKKGMNDPLRRKIPQRFIVPSTISLVQEWLIVQYRKFPQKLTITQKMRMPRQRAMEKRQLLGEMLEGNPKEVKNLKEKVKPSLEKTKYGLMNITYSTSSLTLPAFFKLKEMEESLVEVKQKQSTVDEVYIYKWIVIEPSK